MNRRIISALFALTFSLAPAVAGCGGDDSADAHAQTPTLSGVYRPLQEGAIGSITFSGSQDYLLMPSGCKSGACAEIGTYSLDVASNVLVLDDATTHEKRSIALEILETTGGGSGGAGQGTSLVKSVAPLDLVDPGAMLAQPGQQTTTGGGQQLATSGNGTTGSPSQLLDLIKQLIMNGQQMKQDDQGGNMGGMQGGGGNAPMLPMAPMPNGGANGDMNANMNGNMMPAANPVDCKQGVPTKDTPLAEVAAYFERCPGGP